MKTAFVTMHAKDNDSATRLQSSLLNLKELSNNEPGKIDYEVFQSEVNPYDFFVRESWEDEAALTAHLNTLQLQQFSADTAQWLTRPLEATMLKTITGDPGNRSNAEIIRGLYEAVNKKDLDYIRDMGASFSEWLDVPFNCLTTGKNAIIDPWISWFNIFPDATCEVKSLIASGDHVIAQGIGRGTHKGDFNSPAGLIKPSGISMQVNFCDVYQLINGKIKRADSYFDFFGLLQQLTAGK